MKVQIQYCMQEAAIMFLNVGLGMEMIWGQAACYKEITYAITSPDTNYSSSSSFYHKI